MERLEAPTSLRLSRRSMKEPSFVMLPSGHLGYYTHARPPGSGINQDAMGIRLLSSGSLILSVADGLGGHANGDVAAKMVIDSLTRFRISTAGPRTAERILRKIEQAHESIRQLPGGGGTTIVVAEISDQYLRFFNVGDSIGLLANEKGAILYKTFEHSITGLAVESGIMETQEALDHQHSHVILNALGFSDTRVEISFPLPRKPNETILLASDGLTGNLTIEEIAEILSRGTLAEQMTQLVRRTTERMNGESGNPDDLTIIVYRKI